MTANPKNHEFTAQGVNFKVYRGQTKGSDKLVTSTETEKSSGEQYMMNLNNQEAPRVGGVEYLGALQSSLFWPSPHPKGTPFTDDQGIYNGLTWWEQTDNGKQLTRKKKLLTVVIAIL
ncbi:hypothetical protein Ancab_032884 [Ancistrocladus abbreviatus]